MKILMAQTRELCYQSGSFFLEKIAEGMRTFGHFVDMFDLSDDDADLDCLEKAVGKSYDAIIDINSKLPMLELDTGELLLDAIGAPFYQLIIDHPLFHHPSLMMKVKNAHAIGIDKTHVEYIKKHYPHYRSVGYSTMPGTKAYRPVNFDDKENRLIFLGTYESKEKQLRQIESHPEPYRSMMKRLIELEEIQNCTHEAAMEEICADYDDDFLYLMNKSYLVDKYRRNKEREDILRALGKNGVPVTIMGEGWDKSSVYKEKNLTFKGPVRFAISFGVIALSTMLLDINPLFPMGIHDRVTTAFANHTLAVTDMNKRVDDDIIDGKNAIFFDKHEIARDAEKIRYYLEHKDEICDMTRAAYSLYEQKYSWESFWDYLDSYIKKTARVKYSQPIAANRSQ